MNEPEVKFNLTITGYTHLVEDNAQSMTAFTMSPRKRERLLVFTKGRTAPFSLEGEKAITAKAIIDEWRG